MNIGVFLKIALLGMPVICSLISCGGKIAGGAASETTNGIAGIIRKGAEPVAGVMVTLYPEDFNPVTHQVPDSMRDTTDSKGKYLLKTGIPGIYNIAAVDPHDRTTALLQEIAFPAAKDTILTAPHGTLRDPGTATIHIHELGLREGDYVYLPGTGVFARVDADARAANRVILENVPSAAYHTVNYSGNQSTRAIILDTPLDVIPRGTVVVGPYASWSHSARVYINTSSAGAGVSAEVHHFPLLVRLDPSSTIPSPSSSSIYDVTQSDGSDLRFTKSDGATPLPYQIERWDPVNQVAEIWVQVDTIYGDNSEQCIILYTGNAGAPGKSSGPAVFDTAFGFAGVWHLSEEGNGLDQGYRDATLNENHGTGTGMASFLDGEGRRFQRFNGESSYIQVPDHRTLNFSTGDFTLSALIRADSIPYSSQIICKHSENQGNYELQTFLDSSLIVYVEEDALTKDTLKSGTILEPQLWYHVAAKRSAGILSLYINGERETDTFVSGLKADSPSDLFIGRDPLYSGEFNEVFSGIIDEVRVSRTARSDEWVKLSYQNQKRGSTVVRIE